MLQVLLTALDIMFVQYAVTKTLEKGPSVLLLFAFEYVVLLATVLTLFVKVRSLAFVVSIMHPALLISAPMAPLKHPAPLPTPTSLILIKIFIPLQLPIVSSTTQAGAYYPHI